MIVKNWQMITSYLWNIATAASQLFNAFLLGEPDETVSSRLGRMKRSYGGEFPSHLWYLDRFDRILNRAEDDHLFKSIKEPPRKRELWSWEKKRK